MSGGIATYGNGDGEGCGTGWKYDGTLSEANLPIVRRSGHRADRSGMGDTIEIHFVHSSADVVPKSDAGLLYYRGDRQSGSAGGDGGRRAGQ